ncbi:hypothetical protein QCD58_004555 [Enterobacter hormaechei]|nr:hypothetical protein [Enterobacter hormaechei]
MTGSPPPGVSPGFSPFRLQQADACAAFTDRRWRSLRMPDKSGVFLVSSLTHSARRHDLRCD